MSKLAIIIVLVSLLAYSHAEDAAACFAACREVAIACKKRSPNNAIPCDTEWKKCVRDDRRCPKGRLRIKFIKSDIDTCSDMVGEIDPYIIATCGGRPKETLRKEGRKITWGETMNWGQPLSWSEQINLSIYDEDSGPDCQAFMWYGYVWDLLNPVYFDKPQGGGNILAKMYEGKQATLELKAEMIPDSEVMASSGSVVSPVASGVVSILSAVYLISRRFL